MKDFSDFANQVDIEKIVESVKISTSDPAEATVKSSVQVMIGLLAEYHSWLSTDE